MIEEGGTSDVNICLLSARFPPRRCGVGDYTYFLSGSLAQTGHTIDVLTAVWDLDDSLYPPPAGVRVHRVIRSWEAKELPNVIRHLRRLRPQVLLIQYTPHSFDRRGITFAINLLPILLRFSQHLRIITNFHELYIPFSRSIKHNAGAFWQRSTAMLLASASHALTVTATEWQSRLRSIGIRKPAEVIPVGSNIPLAPMSDDDRVRLRTGILRKSDGFLMAGFGARHDRDIPTALYGLEQLKRYGPAKLLWIGGSSPDHQQMMRVEEVMRDRGLDENDVEWTGALSHPEVSRLLSVCDLMVLPFIDGVSTRRTSAVTALEHGLPLLTTRGACLEPWFVHGENVYLSPVGDVSALGEALVELARKPEIRARIGKGARDLYETHFAWDVIARQVASLVEGGPQLLNRPGQ